MFRRVVLASLLLSLVAPAMAQNDVEAGGALFAQRCQVCHAIGEGAPSKVGPPLNGVVGASVASVPGFSYSAVLMNARGAGRVWTITDLRRFISRPRKLFPGTKMTFAGQTDPIDIGNLVAYLQSFAADGSRIEPPR